MLATKGRAKEELRIDGVKLQIEMPREHPIDTVLGFQGLSALFVIKIDKPQSRSFSHANLSTLLMFVQNASMRSMEVDVNHELDQVEFSCVIHHPG